LSAPVAKHQNPSKRSCRLLETLKIKIRAVQNLWGIMGNCVKPEFLDTINYAICRAVNEHLGEKSVQFFRNVGQYHLDEAVRRGFVKIDKRNRPLENLIGIARYLESTGYMEKIEINRLGDDEAFVEMYGVSVTESSVKLLKEGNHPSHYMTNIMLAALSGLGIRAELDDVSFDEKAREFKEHWKIVGARWHDKGSQDKRKEAPVK